jgi:2-polyprenyl-6-methoxyphenol hydroxylase-like FAD-dependent oxidoreductase
MNNIPEVCIHGAGVVGHALAIALARAGRSVAVISAGNAPSSPQPGADVRAYALNAASQQLLQSLGAWPEATAVTAVQHMQVWGDDGGSILFHADAGESLNTIVDVPALEQALHRQAQATPGIDWLTQPTSAKLHIVCEGRHSATRAQLGVQRLRRPYGQVALATRMRTEHTHCAQASQWFRSGAPEGASILALLPMGGAQGHEVAVVWSLPANQVNPLLHCPEAEFESAITQASQGLLGHLQLISARSSWPLEWGQADHWCGRDAQGQAWVLAGDAARNIHPLAGLGLNLGLADVRALLEHLPTLTGPHHWRPLDDLRLLRTYERQRKAESAPTSWVVDGLQRLFMHPNPTAQKARNWGLNAVNQWPSLKHWIVQRALSPL